VHADVSNPQSKLSAIHFSDVDCPQTRRRDRRRPEIHLVPSQQYTLALSLFAGVGVPLQDIPVRVRRVTDIDCGVEIATWVVREKLPFAASLAQTPNKRRILMCIYHQATRRNISFVKAHEPSRLDCIHSLMFTFSRCPKMINHVSKLCYFFSLHGCPGLELAAVHEQKIGIAHPQLTFGPTTPRPQKQQYRLAIEVRIYGSTKKAVGRPK
jgi:hypothetical protein